MDSRRALADAPQVQPQARRRPLCRPALAVAERARVLADAVSLGAVAALPSRGTRAAQLLSVREGSLDGLTANGRLSIARAGLCPRFPKMTVPARRGFARQRVPPVASACRHPRK